MGADIGALLEKRTIGLSDLKGKSLAVDANNALYQFLSIIRTPDGTPLTHGGKTTSHLVGLLGRTTRLVYEYGIRICYVFDGPPPDLKHAELERRRRVKEKYDAERARALEEGDARRAFSKSVMTSRLTREMVAESQQLLEMLGVPWVQAPSEGEAQAAFMARRDAWASSSQDYDSLLFGSPRVVRYVSVEGRYRMRPEKSSPELLELESVLRAKGITREQLIDISILVGNDFSQGVKGIGPARALALVRRHGGIDGLPADMRELLPDNVSEMRIFFLDPPTTREYDLSFRAPDTDALVSFLHEKGFSERSVAASLARLRKRVDVQETLSDYLG